MKISELSNATAIPIPTLKFYLREGLLQQGKLSSPNQADYDEAHVRRANLIRALREVAGLSIAKIRAIVAALDRGEAVYQVIGQTVDSLGGEPLESFTPAQEAVASQVDELLSRLGLPSRPESLARHQLIAAFTSIRELLFPGITVDLLAPYAQAAIQISRMEQAATPGMFEQDPERTVEQAVLGLALFEPVLIAFRRLAHEQMVHEQFTGKDA